MKNILVAIDFEEQIEKVLNMANKIGRAMNAKIWLMHIVEPTPDFIEQNPDAEFISYSVNPLYLRDVKAEKLRKEHRQIQEYANDLKAKGLEAEGLLIKGAAIEMIIEESKKLQADLIMAGHHKHGFFYNAFIGSVSAEIIKKSKTPVLIVPID